MIRTGDEYWASLQERREAYISGDRASQKNTTNATDQCVFPGATADGVKG